MSPAANRPEAFADKFCVALATLFGVGYVPKAPGTAGSIVTLPAVYGLACLGAWSYAAVTILVTIAAVAVCGRAERVLGGTDPSCIVLDESAGMLIAAGPLTLLPFSDRSNFLLMMGVAFLWFRFFDIRKPGFIRQAERIGGGLGIVLDDVAAGLMAAAAGLVCYAVGRYSIPTIAI